MFGRLYYDMDRRYGYSHEDDTKVKFFSLDVAGDRHCVNFPYLASVLANLQYEDKKYRTATKIAGWSLGISILALAVSIITPLV